MKAKGFSEAVLAQLDKVHAATTNKVHLSQWTLFEAWCRDRDLNPLSATPVCLCDFLSLPVPGAQLKTVYDRGIQISTLFHFEACSGL